MGQTGHTPDCHCASNKSILRTKVFGHFCTADQLCNGISSSNKVHINCPCFSVDNFQQFWSFCILAYHVARRVGLKSTPTPPTVISSPYQLNKQLKQSVKFINSECLHRFERNLNDPQSSHANCGDTTADTGTTLTGMGY